MIQPTVGRVIWYWPPLSWAQRVLTPDQPFKADVVYVHTDGTINVAGFDHFGQRFSDTGVEIVESDGKPSSDVACCTWMPYQKQVAAKEIPPVLHAAAPGA